MKRNAGKPARQGGAKIRITQELTAPIHAPILSAADSSAVELELENAELRAQLAEAQETLRAIREGEVDAIVVAGTQGDRIFSLTGAESIYRLIVETIKEAAFTLAFDGTILFANAQFGDYLKRPAEEILGHALREFVAPDEYAALESFLTTGQKEPVKCRLMFQEAGGGRLPFFISSNLLNQPDSASICVVATDLTELENSTHLIQELRRQKENLRESELRYRTVAENTADFEYWISPTGNFLYASPSCERIYGHSASEFLADPELQRRLIHPDDLPLYQHHLAEERARASCEVEFRIVHPDGSVRYVQHICQPVFDERGYYLGVRGSTRDITKHKQEEEERRKSEQRFRSVLDNSSDTIYRLNLVTRRYEYFSPSSLDVYGYSPQEMMDMTEAEALTRIHPEDRPMVEAMLERMLLSGSASIEFRWEDKSGKYRWLSARSTIIKDAAGSPLYRDGITRDITAGKRAETDLRRSTARLQLLSNTASSLLTSENPQRIINELCRDVMTHLDCQAFFNFMADDEANKLHLNSYAGIPEEEAREIEWLDYGVAVCGCAAQAGCRIIAEDILHIPDPRADLVRRFGIQAYCCHPLLAQGRVIGTISFGTKTRPRFTPDEVEVMRTIADQVAVAMQRIQNLHSLRDLNESLERRVAERTAEVQQQANRLHALAVELSQAEQRERKRLAAILHDHIQQLLVAAQIHLSYVEHASSGTIRPALQGVGSIIREAIDASRSLAMDLTPPILHQGGLARALGWLADRMEEKNLFKVQVQIDSEAEPEGEPMRLLLFECIRELLLNAVKHSGVQEATLRMERTPDNWIKFTIEDAGAGFDTDSASSHGGGLGLFGIQQRITYVGGKFEISSTPGKGTRAILLAPQLEKPMEASAKHIVPALEYKAAESGEFEPKQNRIRVLLVDDHRIVRQGLSSLLKLEPDLEIVAEAENGKQALEMAHQHKPDVVVTDVSMPGMDGVELTRKLIQELPGTKVLGLSMHIDRNMAVAMREAGAVGYLTKGGLTEDLIAAIHKCGTSE